MKQFTPVVKTIGNNKFYIRPFPAFTAAKMTGDLASVAAPLLAAIRSPRCQEDRRRQEGPGRGHLRGGPRYVGGLLGLFRR